jgi:mono/diheme cytochrome c family protein
MKPSRLFASVLAIAAVSSALIYGTGSFGSHAVIAGFFSPVDTVKPKAPVTGPSKTTPVPATVAGKAAQAPVAAPKNAIIAFNEETHEFGKIEQNSFAETTFIIYNKGTDTLEVFSANPSCGCTASFPGKKRIPPGDTSHLFIRFDPHNKAEGDMTKTITVVSNSKTDPQKILRIHGTIYKSKLAHSGGMMHLDGVFQGNCASCHVEKGKGELGAKLYEADCAICHGSKTDNKPGPDITDDKMMSHDAKSWKHVISEGMDNTNMPAFALKHKGPLNDEEIASLVDYLSAFKKNLVREKQLKSPGTGGPQGLK